MESFVLKVDINSFLFLGVLPDCKLKLFFSKYVSVKTPDLYVTLLLFSSIISVRIIDASYCLDIFENSFSNESADIVDSLI